MTKIHTLIHNFSSKTEEDTYLDAEYEEPFVSATSGVGESPTMRYNLDELGMYLTFEIISGGTIYWWVGYEAQKKTIEYSLNGGLTWSSVTASSNDNDGSGSTIATVQAGDVIQFRGETPSYSTDYGSHHIFKTDASFYVYGNVMSLIDKKPFQGQPVF